jgi:glycerol kinase
MSRSPQLAETGSRWVLDQSEAVAEPLRRDANWHERCWVAYQTRDLLEAMQADLGGEWSGETVIRVDGAMSTSDWTMQFLTDILAAPVDRPFGLETTALGAGYLAGMAAGLYPDIEAFAARWAAERRFEPTMSAAERAERYRGWQDAMACTLLRP